MLLLSMTYKMPAGSVFTTLLDYGRDYASGISAAVDLTSKSAIKCLQTVIERAFDLPR
jgi:hypothetical protein